MEASEIIGLVFLIFFFVGALILVIWLVAYQFVLDEKRRVYVRSLTKEEKGIITGYFAEKPSYQVFKNHFKRKKNG